MTIGAGAFSGHTKTRPWMRSGWNIEELPQQRDSFNPFERPASPILSVTPVPVSTLPALP